jgi:hypothetical protein
LIFEPLVENYGQIGGESKNAECMFDANGLRLWEVLDLSAPTFPGIA